MAELSTPILELRAFNVDYVKKQLAQEISSLSHTRHGDKRQVFGRVYDDAIDEGFTVRLSMGVLVPFVICKVDNNGKDIAGWWLEPTAKGLHNYPNIQGWKILVVND